MAAHIIGIAWESVFVRRAGCSIPYSAKPLWRRFSARGSGLFALNTNIKFSDLTGEDRDKHDKHDKADCCNDDS